MGGRVPSQKKDILYSPLPSAAIKATCSKTQAGGGFSATNVNLP